MFVSRILLYSPAEKTMGSLKRELQGNLCMLQLMNFTPNQWAPTECRKHVIASKALLSRKFNKISKNDLVVGHTSFHKTFVHVISVGSNRCCTLFKPWNLSLSSLSICNKMCAKLPGYKGIKKII